MEKICFVSHNATRTGAPIVLFHFLKWLKSNKQTRIEVLFLEGGDMLSDFEALCSCRVLPSLYRPGITGFFRRTLKRITGRDIWLHIKLRYYDNFDIIFFNTTESFRLISDLPHFTHAKLVAWLHEQPFVIKNSYPEIFNHEALNRFSKIICVSSKTAEYLKLEWLFPADKIAIVKPFVNRDIHNNENHEYVPSAKNERFLVGGCGIQEMHKGPDLFIQIAGYIKEKYQDVSLVFEWLGSEGSMSNFLKYDIERMNLQSMVRFPGQKTDVNEFYSKIDIFLLTSRVDSFPLVVIEALAYGKPVLCFDGIGDIVEIVKIIPENVIPYGRTDLMAKRILEYYYNKEMIIVEESGYKKNVEQYILEKQANILYQSLISLNNL